MQNEIDTDPNHFHDLLPVFVRVHCFPNCKKGLVRHLLSLEVTDFLRQQKSVFFLFLQIEQKHSRFESGLEVVEILDKMNSDELLDLSEAGKGVSAC